MIVFYYNPLLPFRSLIIRVFHSFFGDKHETSVPFLFSYAIRQAFVGQLNKSPLFTIGYVMSVCSELSSEIRSPVSPRKAQERGKSM